MPSAVPQQPVKQDVNNVKLASPGAMVTASPGTPVAVQPQQLQQQQRVFIANTQPQGIRVAQPNVLMQGQNQIHQNLMNLTPQQQQLQQQQLQRQFSQPPQNPFQ